MIAIPEGYVAYGWHSFASGGLGAVSRDSVVHLVPEEQRYFVRGGTRECSYGPALCGQKMRGRSPKPDTPSSVALDLERGERLPCRRCFAKAMFMTELRERP